MMVRLFLTSILILCCVHGTYAATSEEVVIKNAGFTRTLSYGAGILKTSKIEANGVQILDQPSVELMIDIEDKGENVTLIPSEFDIKSVIKGGDERETTITAKLQCRRVDYPLAIEITYTAGLKAEYQQKSISVMPCKKLRNATLRRISIDDFNFKGDYLPVTPLNKVELLDTKADDVASPSDFVFDKRSDFGAYDPKASKGFYFYSDAAKPACIFTPGHYLSISEQMNVALDKGYDTSKTIIGAVAGSPDVLFARYRVLTLNAQFASLGRAKQFAAFKKRFDSYFSICHYSAKGQSLNNVSQEVHIINDQGLLVLINSSNEPQKIMLPLAAAGLKSTDALRLSDWSSLDSPVDLGLVQLTDKIEVELPPSVPRIIGINLAPAQ